MINIEKLLKWYIYIFEKVQCYFIVFLLTPGYYLFLVFFIQETIIDTLHPSMFIQWIDYGLSIFGFINVTGNLLLNILTDTSLKKSTTYDKGEDYCEYCQMLKPKGSWHCRICKVCILQRDHHCMFLSRCVGLYNRRYYILYLAHLNIAMIYCNFHSIAYLIHAKLSIEMCIKKILNVVSPFTTYFFIEFRWDIVDIFLAFSIFNIAIFVWSSWLLSYHFSNAINGVTAYEKRRNMIVTRSFMENLQGVFGVRWYLAVVWPFAKSPLPGSVLGLREI